MPQFYILHWPLKWNPITMTYFITTWHDCWVLHVVQTERENIHRPLVDISTVFMKSGCEWTSGTFSQHKLHDMPHILNVPLIPVGRIINLGKCLIKMGQECVWNWKVQARLNLHMRKPGIHAVTLDKKFIKEKCWLDDIVDVSFHRCFNHILLFSAW